MGKSIPCGDDIKSLKEQHRGHLGHQSRGRNERLRWEMGRAQSTKRQVARERTLYV